MGQCRNCQKLKVPDMKEWFKNVRHRLAYLIAPDWIEDLESRLSSLLCHCTGYKLSKSYYPADTMIRAADDHQQALCDECEKIAECENLRQKFKTAKAELEYTKQMLDAAIAGQETLQQYFLAPDKPDGIMYRYNGKTGKWDKYEPYMTIECPEEKDYAFIETAIAKQIFKKPLKESLADYGCPTCGAHINFDGLNGNVEHAPKYCSECGQRLDWRKDNEQRTD